MTRPTSIPAEGRPNVIRRIPGPEPWPLVGWRLNMARFFRSVTDYLSYLHGTYGDLVCLVQGGNDPVIFKPSGRRASTIFVFGSELNRQVLGQGDIFGNDLMKAPKGCPWLSENLSGARGSHHTEVRRMFIPAFKRDHLREYYSCIVEMTENMLSGWKEGDKIDLAKEADEMTADIASKSFYGQEPRTQQRSLAVIARQIGELLYSPMLALPINLPGMPYRRFIKLVHEAENAVLAEIDRKRSSTAAGSDALSMMIKAHDESDYKLSRNELIGNAFALYLAGHDVPASAFVFTLYLLIQHPDVMAELFAELDSNVNGGPPAFEEMWSLPVLDRVIRESLRVLPPPLVVWRRPHRTAILGSHEIPAGSEVIASPYMTHVDPRIYSDPKRFNPGRWQDFKPSPFEYLPFGYGARKCLGAGFGEMFLRISVAMVVQRFRLEMVPRMRIDLKETILMKATSMPLVVRKQDREFHKSKGEVRGRMRTMVNLD